MRRHYVVTDEREGGIKLCTPQRQSVTLQRLTATVGGLNGAVGGKSASGRAKIALGDGWRETLMDAYSVHQMDIAAPVFAPATGEVRLVRAELPTKAAPRRVSAPALCAPMKREGKRNKVRAWRAE